MKASASQVLLGILSVLVVSSVAYNITNQVVFPNFELGQCVKMYPFSGVSKIVKKEGVKYVIATKYAQMDVSYNDLNNYFTVCECPKSYGVGFGKGWKVRR